jgi:3-oxoacyl-[acyl-carrier-protein] synthase-3
MLSILGMGSAQPTIAIDNQFIEKLDVGTNAQWITDKIGIQSRTITLPLEYISSTKNSDPEEAQRIATHSPTDLGVQAANAAIAKAGIPASKIGMVICNCCSPTDVAPAESQRIAARLGIQAVAYDVFTACPAFALHMDYLSNFEEDMLPEYVLCVSTAALSQHTNYNDRSDGAIWGDGAAAWIVSSKHQGKISVVDTYYMADPTRAAAVVVDRFGHFHQDGRAVRDFSVRQTVRLIKRLEDQFNIDWNKDIFVGHQANKTMLEQITNNRNIPDTNHWHNVTYIGNQAGAGAPAALAANWDNIKSGQKIVVAVVGAGLSWGSILFQAN